MVWPSFVTTNIKESQSSYKLIDIAGDSSTIILGINRYATVAEAASNGQCNIRRCRSCHLQAMIAAMNSVPLPVEDAWGNRVLWKLGDDNYKPWFSSSRNLGSHHQIRFHRNVVEWSEIIWFSKAVPQFSFISWLAVRNRLSTGIELECGARFRSAGSVEPDETRDHIFFASRTLILSGLT